jgi:hypothetical protein
LIIGGRSGKIFLGGHTDLRNPNIYSNKQESHGLPSREDLREREKAKKKRK